VGPDNYMDRESYGQVAAVQRIRQIDLTDRARAAYRAKICPCKKILVKLVVICGQVHQCVMCAMYTNLCRLKSAFCFDVEALFWTPTSSAPTGCLSDWMSCRQTATLSHQSHSCRYLAFGDNDSLIANIKSSTRILLPCSSPLPQAMAERGHDGCEERPSLTTKTPSRN
jgi:hypothetical protein